MSPSLFLFVSRIVLAVMFLASGIRLVSGDPGVVEGYFLEDYPPWLGPVLGVLQVSAAVALPWRKTAPYAAMSLLPVMAGAVWTVLQAEKRTAESEVFLPLVLGTLLVSVMIMPEGGRPVKGRRRRRWHDDATPGGGKPRRLPRRRMRRVQGRKLGPYDRPSGSVPMRGPSAGDGI